MGLYDRQEFFNLNTNIVPIICGAGGVGFYVSKMLAMAGVENIILFDNDIIEEHNLNRLDIPLSAIGMNKAEVAKLIIKQMRPNCNVLSYGFKFNPDILDTITINPTHFIDCTDIHRVQLENQRIAKEKNLPYCKAGYNGFSISINDIVGEWDANEEGTQDGYTVTPSYVVPATVVAALTVHKILTNNGKQMAYSLNNIYNV